MVELANASLLATLNQLSLGQLSNLTPPAPLGAAVPVSPTATPAPTASRSELMNWAVVRDDQVRQLLSPVCGPSGEPSITSWRHTRGNAYSSPGFNIEGTDSGTVQNGTGGNPQVIGGDGMLRALLVERLTAYEIQRRNNQDVSPFDRQKFLQSLGHASEQEWAKAEFARRDAACKERTAELINGQLGSVGTLQIDASGAAYVGGSGPTARIANEELQKFREQRRRMPDQSLDEQTFLDHLKRSTGVEFKSVQEWANAQCAEKGIGLGDVFRLNIATGGAGMLSANPTGNEQQHLMHNQDYYDGLKKVLGSIAGAALEAKPIMQADIEQLRQYAPDTARQLEDYYPRDAATGNLLTTGKGFPFYAQVNAAAHEVTYFPTDKSPYKCVTPPSGVDVQSMTSQQIVEQANLVDAQAAQAAQATQVAQAVAATTQAEHARDMTFETASAPLRALLGDKMGPNGEVKIDVLVESLHGVLSKGSALSEGEKLAVWSVLNGLPLTDGASNAAGMKADLETLAMEYEKKYGDASSQDPKLLRGHIHAALGEAAETQFAWGFNAGHAATALRDALGGMFNDVEEDVRARLVGLSRENAAALSAQFEEGLPAYVFADMGRDEFSVTSSIGGKKQTVDVLEGTRIFAADARGSGRLLAESSDTALWEHVLAKANLTDEELILVAAGYVAKNGAVPSASNLSDLWTKARSTLGPDGDGPGRLERALKDSERVSGVLEAAQQGQ